MSPTSTEKYTSLGLDVMAPQPDPDIRDGDESLELTPQELRRLKRIVHWRILPYISLLYLLSAFGGLVQFAWSHLNALAAFARPRFLGPSEIYLDYMRSSN